MADDRGFYGEQDPERAIARLAAHAAEAERDERSTPWLVLFGATVTTALVVAAFVFGLTQDVDPSTPEAQTAPTPAATVTQLVPAVPVAPQATLRPKPQPKPEPEPVAPPVAEEPEPVVQVISQEPARKELPKQVGPNRPITHPIDPDDR